MLVVFVLTMAITLVAIIPARAFTTPIRVTVDDVFINFTDAEP